VLYTMTAKKGLTLTGSALGDLTAWTFPNVRSGNTATHFGLWHKLRVTANRHLRLQRCLSAEYSQPVRKFSQKPCARQDTTFKGTFCDLKQKRGAP